MAKKLQPKKKIQQNGAGRTAKALALTLGVVALCIMVLYFSSIFAPRGPRWMAGDSLETQLWVIVFASTICSLLSAFLIFTYFKDYLELRSTFTLSLVVVMVSFFLFSITSNPLAHALFGFRGGQSLPFTMISLIFSATALAVLAWVSNK